MALCFESLLNENHFFAPFYLGKPGGTNSAVFLYMVQKRGEGVKPVFKKMLQILSNTDGLCGTNECLIFKTVFAL